MLIGIRILYHFNIRATSQYYVIYASKQSSVWAVEVYLIMFVYLHHDV